MAPHPFCKRDSRSTHFSIQPLNAALGQRFPKLWSSDLFSDDLLASQNFLSTADQEINLFDDLEKPLFQVLLIQDKPGPKNKLILLSAEDAKQVANIFQEEEETLPPNRQMWLLRPQGNLASPGPSPYNKQDLLNQPEIARLLLQANFFSGNLAFLKTPFGQKELAAWLKEVKAPQLAQSIFENAILKAHPQEGIPFPKPSKCSERSLKRLNDPLSPPFPPLHERRTTFFNTTPICDRRTPGAFARAKCNFFNRTGYNPRHPKTPRESHIHSRRDRRFSQDRARHRHHARELGPRFDRPSMESSPELKGLLKQALRAWDNSIATGTPFSFLPPCSYGKGKKSCPDIPAHLPNAPFDLEPPIYP